MCELLGMSFNVPVRPSISFRGFRQKGKKNPHGWGLAFYPDKSAQVIKEPLRADESPLSRFLQKYAGIRSKIFIAHVRFASKGQPSYANTHPFQRELNGTEYVFAHNGTIDISRMELGRFKPVGETDSEHVFCHLLDCIEKKRNNPVETGRFFDWLAEKLKEINKHGTFNCIFSDGEHLFCYCDKNRHNAGLSYVERKSPYGRIRLLDEDWEICLTEEKDPNQRGFIIATKKLTDEPWETFKPCELIVFKNGCMIYSNHRNVAEISDENLEI